MIRRRNIVILLLLIILVVQTIYYNHKIDSMQRIINIQSSTIQIVKNAYEEKIKDNY